MVIQSTIKQYEIKILTWLALLILLILQLPQCFGPIFFLYRIFLTFFMLCLVPRFFCCFLNITIGIRGWRTVDNKTFWLEKQTRASLNVTVECNKWPYIYRVACPIYNGTCTKDQKYTRYLSSFLWKLTLKKFEPKSIPPHLLNFPCF